MLDDIKVDPEIHSGAACFVGTRVPVSILFDYLSADYSVSEFLEQYPTVEKAQVINVLRDLCTIAAEPQLLQRT